MEEEEEEAASSLSAAFFHVQQREETSDIASHRLGGGPNQKEIRLSGAGRQEAHCKTCGPNGAEFYKGV